MTATHPEIGVTPETLIDRAIALRPKLIEEQAATEERTYYSQEMHEEFQRAGFYRLYIPRRYGGYEFDVPAMMRLMLETARGCPSTAWCMGLASGHALQLGSWWPEQAQSEIFGDGDFRAASVAAPIGFAEPTDDGWSLTGKVSYCSGIPYSTHYMGQALTPGEQPGGPPGPLLLFYAPRGVWEMQDDWGHTIGLKGSGSHSVVVEEAFVPDHHVIPFGFFQDVAGGTVGSALHGNPMYAGQFMAFAMGELNSVQVGAAQAMLDEAERILTTRSTNPTGNRMDDGGARRAENINYQRTFGLAMSWTDSAESIMVRCGQLFHEYAAESVAGGEPFMEERTMRVYGQLMTVQKLTWEAGDELFRTASSSGAKDGARMQRYWRDLCAFRTNGLHQLDFRAPAIARARFGLDVDFAA